LEQIGLRAYDQHTHTHTHAPTDRNSLLFSCCEMLHVIMLVQAKWMWKKVGGGNSTRRRRRRMQ